MAKVYSSVNDFVLFPRDQSYMGTVDPRLGDNLNNMHYQQNAVSNMLRHGDISGQASTSYEPYPPVSAYSSATSAYFGAQNMPYETRKGNMARPMRGQTPSGSPSPSISQAFDHPPSTLSSASGASAQSNDSSTDGSPYASATHVLPYDDKWSGPLHGLGIAPGIVSSESFCQDSFPPANFENDLILEDSKFPTYVGKCDNTFSPSISHSQPFASSVFSGLVSQEFVPAFCSRPLALETVVVSTKEVTVDSILQEANSKIQTPVQLISPISATSAAASPTFISSQQASSPTQTKTSFRTPLTPSPGVSRLPSRPTLPHSSGFHAVLGHPSISWNDVRAPRSPQQPIERCHPCDLSTPPPISQSQDPFFGQSSGRLVAPLESSCRFSLLSSFLHCENFYASVIVLLFARFCLGGPKLIVSNLCRSFSHPTTRHTYCSQHYHCTLPRRY